MNRAFIYSYSPVSGAARDLARALGIRRIRHHGSRYRPRAGDILINWGSSSLPVPERGICVINSPLAVQGAVDKLSFLRQMREADVDCPPFTTDRAEAQEWATRGVVVARTLLRASQGRGIVLASRPEEVVDAPLYVRYVKKSAEYRVHVLNGRVIDIQQKRRRRDAVEINHQIRNVRNGWVFVRGDVDAPRSVITLATDAVNASGLDFGAVDVIYNTHYNSAYVLEVNTAPGLQGTTLDSYVTNLRTYLEGLRT